MRIAKFILIFLFSISISSFAQEGMDRFQKANELYQNEEFDKAIAEYHSILGEGYISDDLHYNLGNAYFRSADLPRAILHYEKAIKINPANEDAKHNLEYANSKTVDKIETPPKLFFYRWWDSIIHSLSSYSWSMLVLLFAFAALIALSLFFFSKSKALKKISFYIALIGIFSSLLSWFIARQQHLHQGKFEYAIIMSPTVNINSSPSEGSSKLFVLHEGSKIKLENESGDWFEISLPNGNSGWIPKSQLAPI